MLHRTRRRARALAFQADALAVNATVPSTLEFPFSAPPGGRATHEVAPDVLWLRMPLPFALDHINLWLLADGDGWTQVDTGYGDAPTRALWNSHFATTLGAHPITRVIATHYHPDHLGNAAWLCQRLAGRARRRSAGALSRFAYGLLRLAVGYAHPSFARSAVCRRRYPCRAAPLAP